MLARKLDIRRRMSTLSLSKGLSLFSAAHLPVSKSLAAKSSVSVTSKLIQTKGLQVLHFCHLRKTGGRGSYGLVHTPPLVLNIPYLTTSFSPFHPPPVPFITQYPP